MASQIVPIATPTSPDYPAAASRLYISDGVGLPPTFICALFKVTKEADEKTGAGEQYESLRSGLSASMSEKQWAAWLDQPDDEYIAACVLELLGLEAA